VIDRYFLGDPSEEPVLLAGDGGFGFEVVGEAHCQEALEDICGGRTESGVEHECVALLVHDNGNEYDANAVAIFVGGLRVGYLPRTVAKRYRESMCSLNPRRAAVGCRAIIRGGWDRGGDDVGHFGIALDVAQPLQILTDD
jgi:hypothetical protein